MVSTAFSSKKSTCQRGTFWGDLFWTLSVWWHATCIIVVKVRINNVFSTAFSTIIFLWTVLQYGPCFLLKRYIPSISPSLSILVSQPTCNFLHWLVCFLKPDSLSFLSLRFHPHLTSHPLTPSSLGQILVFNFQSWLHIFPHRTCWILLLYDAFPFKT